MTANADALKKIISQRLNLKRNLDSLFQRLAQLDSVHLSGSIPENLQALDVNIDDYYSLDEMNARIARSETFAKVNSDTQELRHQLTDMIVVLNRDEAFLKPLIEQLHNPSDEDKRLQEDEESASIRLGIIKDKLYSLLPKDLTLSAIPSLEQDPLDWLVNLVTQQLQLGKILPKTVEKILVEKISPNEEDTVGKYVNLKWEKHGAFSRYIGSVVFSNDGENLKNYVISYEERLKNLEAAQAFAIKSLEDSLAKKEKELKKIQEVSPSYEIAFVAARQEIANHFLKSKKSAEQICGKIKEAQDDINAAHQQLELITDNIYSIDHLADLNATESLGCLESAAREIAASIEKITKPCDLLQAYTNVAKMKLTEAKSLCQECKLQYGQARIWTKLPKKIDKEQGVAVMELSQIVTAQKASLVALIACGNSVNKRLEEIRKQKAELIQMEVDVEVEEQKPVEPDGIVAPDPKTEVEAKKRYHDKTLAYSSDLTRDIKERLTDFEKSAKPGSKQALCYVTLIIQLGIQSNNPTIDEITHKLKACYAADVDSNEVALEQRVKVGKILDTAGQRPMKIALEKYHVLTDALKNLQEQGVNGFLDVLKDKKNQDILNKHRDRSFMAFIRGCGARVAAIFSSEPRASYGGMFYQPKGKRYAHDIARITDEVHSKRRRMA